MSKYQSYRDLIVWQESINLVENIYQTTKSFPKEEMFGLTSQIRRSSVSIPANIAEGYGRNHTKEYLNHLSIANGSLSELETHIIISLRLNYINEENYHIIWNHLQTIGKLLYGLRKSLNSSLNEEKQNSYPNTQYPKPNTL
jgi:four helix bundle protein